MTINCPNKKKLRSRFRRKFICKGDYIVINIFKLIYLIVINIFKWKMKIETGSMINNWKS